MVSDQSGTRIFRQHAARSAAATRDARSSGCPTAPGAPPRSAKRPGSRSPARPSAPTFLRAYSSSFSIAGFSPKCRRAAKAASCIRGSLSSAYLRTSGKSSTARRPPPSARAATRVKRVPRFDLGQQFLARQDLDRRFQERPGPLRRRSHEFAAAAPSFRPDSMAELIREAPPGAARARRPGRRASADWCSRFGRPTRPLAGAN